MRSRTTMLIPLLSAAVLTAGLAAVPPAAVAGPPTSTTTDYLVLMKGATVDAAAKRAIAGAGGTITEENAKLGYAYVRSTNATFARSIAASDAVAGAARERVIGRSPQQVRARSTDLERLSAERASLRGRAGAAVAAASKGAEPLANLQWDMRQVGATPTGSYARDTGSKAVRVGVIDTGIDGTHPDIAPNFNRTLSANFVTDNPAIDGPCETASCQDPTNVDDQGHGTHVASTIGSPINGLGVAGVAPDVDLVSIRAAQDSGLVFLEPTLKALEYAGDIGVDVVNLSLSVDPWLFNCLDNPADSLAERTEQRVIRTATQRALAYAINRGVLPVAALGNESTDLGRPTTDASSPAFPPGGGAKERTIDNSCLMVPTESRGVVAVSATGPSTRKAYYSNWGTEQTDVSAPGGDYYDSAAGTGNVQNMVLAAYPKSVAASYGDIDEAGEPTTPFVVRSCTTDSKTCGYYQYLQGTSMAAPHAAGVAALLVSAHGKADRTRGGLTLAPARTTKLLYASARQLPCPSPRTYHYTRVLAEDAGALESEARCSGPRSKNGFYGRGLVNAYNATR